MLKNQESVPVVKDLVLVGGGHAHVGVLRRLAMKPVPGLRVTLLARDIHTPYSGMLPGLIAGHYDYDQTHIDLRPLCGFAGARLYHAEVNRLDLENRLVHADGRPPVSYDLLSINTGSRPSSLGIEGADQHAIAVKPIDHFLQRWETVIERVLASRGAFRLAVVGSGAGGVELLLSVQYRLQSALRERGDDPSRVSFSLFTRDPVILMTHAAGVRQRFEQVFAKREVQIYPGAEVARVSPDALLLKDGREFPADAIMWATHASTPRWPAAAGLETDEQGFICVDEHLQSVSHANVFAAGDVASMPMPRPKSGVFAVRQGPVLSENLRRAATGQPLKAYKPQKNFLGLISTGDKYAIASRGNWSMAGGWLWTVKDWIDTRFMRMFNELPEMVDQQIPEVAAGIADDKALEALSRIPMRCGGCGAKVGASILSRVLQRLPTRHRADVLLGRESPDDAAMLAVPEGKTLVQSVDFFRAFIDDNYIFGQIAANHALGDLYAMGAEPQSALAMAMVPYGRESVVEEALFELLSGAQLALDESGAVLAGGHSGEGAELAFGLTVNGLVETGQALKKSGLQPGDALILTKPLGTGTLMAANMRYRAKGRWVDGAVQGMLQSNRAATEIIKRHGASACTDVTGFGVAGHLFEMLQASQVDARLHLKDFPVLDGAQESIAMGIVSSLQPENLRLRRAITNHEQASKYPGYPLLFDPQTAGGLLLGVRASTAKDCLNDLCQAGYKAANIGEVLPPQQTSPGIEVR